MEVTPIQWLSIFVLAAVAALAWTWLITWAIKTFSIQEEGGDEEEGTGSRREP